MIVEVIDARTNKTAELCDVVYEPAANNSDDYAYDTNFSCQMFENVTYDYAMNPVALTGSITAYLYDAGTAV